MKITLTYWDRDQLHQLLSAQNIARAPLGEVSEMLKLREKLDVSEIKAEDTKKYELTLSDNQVKRLHSLANSPNVQWPISEYSVELHGRLQEAMDKVSKRKEKAAAK